MYAFQNGGKCVGIILRKAAKKVVECINRGSILIFTLDEGLVLAGCFGFYRSSQSGPTNDQRFHYGWHSAHRMRPGVGFCRQVEPHAENVSKLPHRETVAVIVPDSSGAASSAECTFEP